VDRCLAESPGVYGILVATPDRILFERYGIGGAPDRVTPSWSMNKSMTGTLIGRLINLGWLEGVHVPAPAPAWRDPRGVHALITIDDLLRMRSGLAMPCVGEGGAALGFEGSAVYFDAVDAFAAAQANMVAVRPGAVFRYVNAGINVLAAIIRDRIEQRGLSYHPTIYSQLPNVRRHRGQPDRLRRGLRHVARLGEACRAVSPGRHVERRAAPSGRLGRLRARRDARRHKLCSNILDECGPALSSASTGCRVAVRRLRSAGLHPARRAPDRRGVE
jgi:hypothetical protein